MAELVEVIRLDMRSGNQHHYKQFLPPDLLTRIKCLVLILESKSSEFGGFWGGASLWIHESRYLKMGRSAPRLRGPLPMVWDPFLNGFWASLIYFGVQCSAQNIHFAGPRSFLAFPFVIRELLTKRAYVSTVKAGRCYEVDHAQEAPRSSSHMSFRNPQQDFQTLFPCAPETIRFSLSQKPQILSVQ